MPHDYPFVENLIAKLNIAAVQVIDKITVLPTYSSDNPSQITGIKLFSKNIDYLRNIEKALNEYLENQLRIIICDLPVLQNNESFTLIQNKKICILELKINQILILCQKLSLNFMDIYNDCIPKINSHTFTRPYG